MSALMPRKSRPVAYPCPPGALMLLLFLEQLERFRRPPLPCRQRRTVRQNCQYPARAIPPRGPEKVTRARAQLPPLHALAQVSTIRTGWKLRIANRPAFPVSISREVSKKRKSGGNGNLVTSSHASLSH